MCMNVTCVFKCTCLDVNTLLCINVNCVVDYVLVYCVVDYVL